MKNWRYYAVVGPIFFALGIFNAARGESGSAFVLGVVSGVYITAAVAMHARERAASR